MVDFAPHVRPHFDPLGHFPECRLRRRPRLEANPIGLAALKSKVQEPTLLKAQPAALGLTGSIRSCWKRFHPWAQLALQELAKWAMFLVATVALGGLLWAGNRLTALLGPPIRRLLARANNAWLHTYREVTACTPRTDALKMHLRLLKNGALVHAGSVLEDLEPWDIAGHTKKVGDLTVRVAASLRAKQQRGVPAAAAATVAAVHLSLRPRAHDPAEEPRRSNAWAARKLQAHSHVCALPYFAHSALAHRSLHQQSAAEGLHLQHIETMLNDGTLSAEAAAPLHHAWVGLFLAGHAGQDTQLALRRALVALAVTPQSLRHRLQHAIVASRFPEHAELATETLTALCDADEAGIQAAAHGALGAMRAAQPNWPSAILAHRSAMTHAAAGPDSTLRATCLLNLAQVLMQAHRHAPTPAHLQEAAQVLQDAQDLGIALAQVRACRAELQALAEPALAPRAAQTTHAFFQAHTRDLIRHSGDLT